MMPSSADDDARGKSIEIGLGLGSNMGDKPGNIRRALRLLQESGAVEILALSSIYKTAPWGYLAQEPFANACALARTKLDPHALLRAVKKVEADMGREKTVRWGPRVIDVDILFYGDEHFTAADLILPHKELFNRAFVLVPLAEIAPNLMLGGRSVSEAARHVAGQGVAKWD